MNSTVKNEKENDYLFKVKKLLLDDDPIRTPEFIFEYTKNDIYTYPNWDVVRNYDEFVQYIKDNGVPRVFSADHDLADVHYKVFLTPDTIEGRREAWANYHTLTDTHEMTGYDCLKWLIDYCHDNDIVFPVLFIHTKNNVGYENMVFYYKSALKNKYIKLS